MLNPDASMFPQADSACIEPSAMVRNRGGTLSASKVVAAPNIPPTPSPQRKRETRNSMPVRAIPESPEKMV